MITRLITLTYSFVREGKSLVVSQPKKNSLVNAFCAYEKFARLYGSVVRRAAVSQTLE